MDWLLTVVVCIAFSAFAWSLVHVGKRSERG